MKAPAILVFSRTAGFRHESIPNGIAALRGLGEKRGFDLEVSEDPACFSRTLARFDLVLFLNTQGTILDATQREALVRFVHTGKGWVGIHGASGTEEDWPWYGGLVGAYFDAHPAVQRAVVRVEDADHPATRGLPASFTRNDEWYGFRRNPRPQVRVLLSLDETSYEPGDGAMGDDHPIAWCREYEGGRSFYTALGHTQECYEDPVFLEHIAGGIAWALGGKNA